MFAASESFLFVKVTSCLSNFVYLYVFHFYLR